MEKEINRHTEQKIIEKLKLLDYRQIPEVFNFIDSLAEKRTKRQDLILPEDRDRKDPIQALRGRGKGERLVEKLLQSRQKDRNRDERRHTDICT